PTLRMAGVLGLPRDRSLRVLEAIAVAVHDQEDERRHWIIAYHIGHDRGIQGLVNAFEVRLLEDIDASDAAEILKDPLDDRPQDVFVEAGILRDDEHLHRARSSHRVENSASIPRRASISSNWGRSFRRFMIVPGASGDRPKATTFSRCSFGSAPSSA